MNIPLEDICNLVSLILGIKQVSGEDRLQEDLGAQSLDVINIASAVDRKYNIFLEESALAQIKTVNDLHRLVQESSN